MQDIVSPWLMNRQAVSKLANGAFQLRFHVKPGAKQSQVTEVSHDSINLQIAAPPRDGEANEEVLQWVAANMNLRPRHFTFASGHRSRDKTLVLVADNGIYDTVDSILAHFESLSKS